MTNNVYCYCYYYCYYYYKKKDVGNKAAVFPLQLLGFDVDIINSVHFSNHTGHPNGFKGEIMDGDQLINIIKGLEMNHLLSNIHHLLTGYIGSITFLRSVLNVLQLLKKYNPNIRYVCDPVLGDEGKVYVPQELVFIYRDEVVPLANIVTPNQFEVELLTGIKIHTMDDAIRACNALHDLGPQFVVITSLVIKNNSEQHDDNDNDDNTERITILASQCIKCNHDTKSDESNDDDNNNSPYIKWVVHTPKIPGRFTGTGDVTAALFLAWTAKTNNDLKLTLEKVASTMYTLIKITSEQASGTIASNELRLIQCKRIIENPNIIFQAVQVQ